MNPALTKTSPRRFQTIVLGLGAMGSAALYQLAKKGATVLGIDQFSPPHTKGSTHGDTRITRLAIGEGDAFTPLALRSHELWREIERATGKSLLTSTGGLIISSAGQTSINHVANFFQNTVTAAQRHGIRHDLLNAAQIRTRFPQFNVRNDERGYFEPEAGFLRPEECIRAQLDLAKKHGAEIRTEEKALGYEVSGGAVVITTAQGKYTADKLILTAGPWFPQWLEAGQAMHFKIFRQVLFWFDVDNSHDQFTPGQCPIFIWELPGKSQGIYGFPAVDGPKGGLKIATEQYQTATTADSIDRRVTEGEMAAMHENFVAPFLGGVSHQCVKAVVCPYTVTRDAGFVIDFHPHHKEVILVSPCSGHGFKHSAAIGEALSELAIEGATRFDLSAFRLARLTG